MKLSTVFIPGFFLLLSSIPVFVRLARAHLYSLLFEPVGVTLVLAVHFHLLGPQRQAAVTVEVQAIVSTDVRPLRLPIAILRLQKLRQARLCPLGSADQKVGDGGSLHGAVPAEGEARLAVDVLRISCIRPIVTLVDRDLDLCSFGMRHVVEDEAGVGQFEVFEETVQLPAVQCAPRTVEVIPGLGLLPCVVVVLKLVEDS